MCVREREREREKERGRTTERGRERGNDEERERERERFRSSPHDSENIGLELGHRVHTTDYNEESYDFWKALSPACAAIS